MTGRTLMDHAHGVAQPDCSHPACVAANRRYHKRWAYDRAHGILRTVDADQVRLHLATLTGAGWSLRSIAGAAGTGPSSVARLANGQQTRLTSKLAERLLAVDPRQVPSTPSVATSEPFVSKVGTVRRIQALMALGWSHPAMGDYLGEGPHWTANKLHQRGRWVTRTVHDRVAAMYRDLSSRPGPSSRTRARAAKLGYLSPIAWDDIDHDTEPNMGSDDEAGAFDEVAVQRRIGGDMDTPLTKADRAEVVRRLRGLGMSATMITKLTGLRAGRYETEGVAS